MSDNTEITPFNDGMADLINYNPVWYWMMIFIVLGIVMLTLFFLLRVKSNEASPKKPVLPKNRLAVMTTEVDKAFLMVSNRAISTQEACQRVSIILREYLHLQTGLPAQTMTVTDLEHVQAPPRVVENIRYLYPIVFGDKQVSTYEEFLQFMNSSRAVLDGTWN